MDRTKNSPPNNRPRRGPQGGPKGGGKSHNPKVRQGGRGGRGPRARLEVVQKRQDRHWLYGIHAVKAALANGRRVVHRLVASAEVLPEIEKELALRADLKRDIVAAEGFKGLLPIDAVHQNVALEVSALPHTPLEPFLASTQPTSTLVLLDQVTDPRNFGAILRSAVAFDVAAVVVPERHSAELGGVAAKAASGALDMVPVAQVVNLSRAFEQLKAAGFWIIGLDGDAQQPLRSYERPAKTALVLGSEGRGLRRLVAERCDLLVSLPTNPRIESLNVAVAAGVALYELTQKRPG
ncbi:MAG: 23S rRNA (guanosine(2251)-2'-O)-methyltransferase RlmB [Pseudomonadota bacterium]